MGDARGARVHAPRRDRPGASTYRVRTRRHGAPRRALAPDSDFRPAPSQRAASCPEAPRDRDPRGLAPDRRDRGGGARLAHRRSDRDRFWTLRLRGHRQGRGLSRCWIATPGRRLVCRSAPRAPPWPRRRIPRRSRLSTRVRTSPATRGDRVTLSRREALLAAGAATLAGCARVTPLAREASTQAGPAAELTSEERLLRRLVTEPTPSDRALLRSEGRDRFVAAILRADAEESSNLVLRLRHLDGLHLDPVTAMDLPKERVLNDLQQGAILRATYGANPLLERMVLFWGEYFNVYARKADATFYRGEEERILRAHALGSFPAMVAAIAKAPAMLAYLDNDANRKGHPNENFARELMELHTLGVEGPYAQRDVQEVARAFTGWTVETRFLRPRGHFRFDEDAHDSGAKTVLGEPIPSGGVEEGETIVARLARHPATATRLARRLTRYFH
ncbi:DUF1800 family protein, partial [bacterium]